MLRSGRSAAGPTTALHGATNAQRSRRQASASEHWLLEAMAKAEKQRREGGGVVAARETVKWKKCRFVACDKAAMVRAGTKALERREHCIRRKLPVRERGGKGGQDVVSSDGHKGSQRPPYMNGSGRAHHHPPVGNVGAAAKEQGGSKRKNSVRGREKRPAGR